MKFPRNARILKGRQDAAPYAAVFFLLVLFVLLGTLVYTPGIRVPLDLPAGGDLPGTDRPCVPVAVDANGQFYFENAMVEDADLGARLRQQVAAVRQPLCLLVQADKGVRHERLIRLSTIAREAGIHEALLATLPPPPAPGGPAAAR